MNDGVDGGGKLVFPAQHQCDLVVIFFFAPGSEKPVPDIGQFRSSGAFADIDLACGKGSGFRQLE